VDQSWKDHLYQMDQVRDSISYRAFSQRDPRIEFKREAGRLFDEMQSKVREKVTDLVFKAKLMPAAPPAPPGQAQAQAAQRQQQQQPSPIRPAQPAIAAAAAAASAACTAAQRRDLETAERASTTTAAAAKRKPVRRAAPAIGRNEPCPCGSGKKYKHCCGKRH
jgi:preprotein translocase subunit SecA